MVQYWRFVIKTKADKNKTGTSFPPQKAKKAKGAFHNDENNMDNIYGKLMSNKLDVNLGYLYENVVAQMIVSSGRELYYHTWNKKDSTHYYEIDFLITKKSKVVPIEVKSGIVKTYNSLNAFCEKYSKIVGERYVISQKDLMKKGMLKISPFYLFSQILQSKE